MNLSSFRIAVMVAFATVVIRGVGQAEHIDFVIQLIMAIPAGVVIGLIEAFIYSKDWE